MIARGQRSIRAAQNGRHGSVLTLFKFKGYYVRTRKRNGFLPVLVGAATYYWCCAGAAAVVRQLSAAILTTLLEGLVLVSGAQSGPTLFPTQSKIKDA